MLSRRIVRVKVMQVLYAMSRDQTLKMSDAVARYNQSVSKTFEMYIYNLQILLKIVDYSIKDAQLRDAKLRPTDEDRAFTPKMATNKFSKSLWDHPGLKKLFAKYSFDEKVDDDHIKTLYTEYSKTTEYKVYVSKDIKDDEEHVNALLNLYRFCTGNELFNDMLEDYHYNWEDDKSLILGATKKTLKALPAEEDFYKEFLPDPEVVKDFGEVMLNRVNAKDKEYLDHIEPNLKNWDADRVAIIDMILLKMALCELMEFKSIPSKVTLNEFVEISKLYSTDKSKEFINGILDRMFKKLDKEGKIIKEGRGLIDN
jgi:transcription antitermination protein NusB